jgi:hypothetical protein
MLRFRNRAFAVTALTLVATNASAETLREKLVRQIGNIEKRIKEVPGHWRAEVAKTARADAMLKEFDVCVHAVFAPRTVKGYLDNGMPRVGIGDARFDGTYDTFVDLLTRSVVLSKQDVLRGTIPGGTHTMTAVPYAQLPADLQKQVDGSWVCYQRTYAAPAPAEAPRGP